MTIYCYTLKNDSGFAPNPFHGACTLACCKPQIRRGAKPGDWILGISRRDEGQRLVYAMRVDEVLPFDAYFRDPRFRAKKPRPGPDRPLVQRCGDNCYEPMRDGSYRQLPSFHYDWKRDREDARTKATDLGGRHVLVSWRFSYLGDAARPVPRALGFMLPGRFYRSRFTSEQERAIHSVIAKLPKGRVGNPAEWGTRVVRCSFAGVDAPTRRRRRAAALCANPTTGEPRRRSRRVRLRSP